MVVLETGLLMLPSVTLAATKVETEPELFGGGQWILSLLSLIVVVFLAYQTTRFLAGRYSNLPTRHIKVAESLCLGANRHLYLLLVNKQALLVGSTEQGLALIKEYSDPDFYEELSRMASSAQMMSSGNLTAWLAPLLKNKETSNEVSVAADDGDTQKVLGFGSKNPNQFKTLLNSLINGQQQKPAPLPEETSRVTVKERLEENLARIRAWKTKGRG